MLRGIVVHAQEARVPIVVRGESEREIEIEAVIDTGFTEILAIPQHVIDALAMPFREIVRFALADGVESEMAIHRAEVLWNGRWRSIMAVATHGDALLGMGLLRGYRLQMDVVDRGEV